jgi:hypothetical protein
MEFKIVFPVVSTVFSDSFKDAIKQYIETNRAMNINQMIIHDRMNRMQANIRYYNQDGRSKMGINMFPVAPTLAMPFMPMVVNIPNIDSL